MHSKVIGKFILSLPFEKIEGKMNLQNTMDPTPPVENNKKPYVKPSIIFAQDLEVRAGSPVDSLDAFDPLDLNSDD